MRKLKSNEYVDENRIIRRGKRKTSNEGNEGITFFLVLLAVFIWLVFLLCCFLWYM